MKKILLFAALLLCMLVMSSCTQLEFSAEALMNAPVLTPEQTEIKTALRAHLGVEESAIQFKYPKAGDYRSAFVMKDLDADGNSEAIVFYSLRNSAENKAFINVMTETPEGWVSTCNVGGLGTNVDMVEFTSVTRAGRENLIVGWSSGGGERIVSVYSYDEAQLLVRDYRGSYTEMLVCDINKDGLDNLLLLRSNEVSLEASVVMVAPNARGELKDTARLTLEEGITSFGRVQVGMLDETTEAIFIDALIESEVVTNIVRYDASQKDTKSQLVNVMEGLPREVQTAFRRPEAVYCADINKDGLIEVPRMTELPGYGEGESNALALKYATEYLRVSKSKVEPVWYGYVNVKAGYRFEFPESWVDVATVYEESNKLRFIVYRGDIYDTSEELLMILTGAVNDKNDTTEYRPLETARGVYYAAIPRVENKELKLTFAQVQQRFSIIS